MQCAYPLNTELANLHKTIERNKQRRKETEGPEIYTWRRGSILIYIYINQYFNEKIKFIF